MLLGGIGFLGLLGWCLVSTMGAKLEACWRQATSRGAGVFPDPHTRNCPATKPDYSEGLCYLKCSNKKRVGQGPLCWDDCHQTRYANSELVFCCDSRQTCKALIELVGSKYPEALAKLAADVVLDPYNIVRVLEDFRRVLEDAEQLRLPYCSKLKFSNDDDSDDAVN